MEIFHSTFEQVDHMELSTLLDLISVYEKIHEEPKDKDEGNGEFFVVRG